VANLLLVSTTPVENHLTIRTFATDITKIICQKWQQYMIAYTLK
jgi:hypothetical protein